MFDWLRNLLFTPKRAEMIELQGRMDILESHVHKLMSSYGTYVRENKKEEDQAEMQLAIAEATKLLQEGKAPGDIAKTLLVTHPTVALKLAKQFGIKL